VLVFGQEQEDRSIRQPDQETIELLMGDTAINNIFVDTIINNQINDIPELQEPVKKESASFESEVSYRADTMSLDPLNNKVILRGNASLAYQEIELTAAYIEISQDSNLLYAIGVPDTSGVIVGKPIFKQGSEEFEADKLRYNYSTKKGLVFGVVTEQQGGIIHSGRTKMINDSTYCLRNGKYTTCDAANPHFYLEMTKAKVLSNKKIVTGPAYLVVEDLPLYFAILPFGFFPNSPKYSSGFLMPSYGEERNRGFFLRDIGYYWAASDYFDAALRGDIFSKGSRGIKLQSNYKLRYKFGGSLDVKYYKNIYGDKGLPDYREQNDFAITWSHRVDPKASPSQTFSASVNLSTSEFDQNNSYSVSSYLTNAKQSSLSYTKRWENSPFSMSANARHSQNSRDTTISLTIPQMTFTMSRIYPFKRKKKGGKDKWFEKIGVNYTGDFQNKINTKEYELSSSSFATDWNNGVKHSIPISTSLKALKYLTISPSFSYNERWYSKEIRKEYDPETGRLAVSDTIYGFTRNYDYSFSVGTSTRIYGNYIPRNPESSIKGIRHVMTPSINFSMRPDFSDPRFGMYETFEVYDTLGVPQTFTYPYHEGGIYGTSSRGKSGSIGFSLNNTLEMKKVDRKDTTEVSKDKKVKLLDQLSLSGSYNLAADSLNLSIINVRGRTKVAGVNINFGAALDPYSYADGRRINEFYFNETGKLARLTNANLAFGMSFNSKKKKEREGEEAAKTDAEKAFEENRRYIPGEYPDYTDFSIPWDFRFNYSFRYNRRDPEKSANITQTLDFSGNISLTEKWKMGVSSGFDIEERQITFTQFNLSRNLHCWQMSLNLVPFGYRKSYNFTLRASSAMLRDLKITKRQSFYDN
jgi:lipopolysaccharide assembly outer membrane protein LptD (OstA)